jgi:hypothetical protein
MSLASFASRWRSLPPWASPAAVAGLCAVAAARLSTLPRSLWEHDEVLFLRGVESFQPLLHQPHPPGYPAFVGLGKLFAAVAAEPFRGLVALSVFASLLGYLALVDAFAHAAAGNEAPSGPAIAAGALGAALFHLSPSMLVYGPLALSDPTALMFVALALAGAARLGRGGLGAVATCAIGAGLAIGSRPQLALSILPLLAVALWLARGGRRRLQLLGLFAATCLCWFVPLVVAVGGLGRLLPFLGEQAGHVATWDTAVPRAGMTASEIATRFLAHPWGTRATSVPLLAAAAVGAVALVAGRRWRAAVPIAVFSGVELAVCLAVLAPRDAVRYALPALVGVAFLAGLGLAAVAWRLRAPLLGWVAAVALAGGFVHYTWPLLDARSSAPSPPVMAAEWIRGNLPRGAALLLERDLMAHGAYLLPEFPRSSVEEGLDHFADQSTPVYLVGETVDPGSRVFSWPDSDAYGKLTRLLYRVVAVTPVPVETRYRALRGVHKYERDVARAGWRWLDADAAVRLFPGDGGKEATVILGLPQRVPWPANRVRLTIAGGVAVEVDVPRGATRSVTLPLPSAATVDLEVRAAEAFVPLAEGIGGDRRRVAVQLLGIRLGGGPT